VVLYIKKKLKIPWKVEAFISVIVIIEVFVSDIPPEKTIKELLNN